MDEGDYPSEKMLRKLRKWPIDKANDALDFIAQEWWCPDFGVSHDLREEEAKVVHAEEGDKFLRLATAGWSGNEELIYAFKKSYAWMMTWRLSSRGGLFIFQYTNYSKAKAEANIAEVSTDDDVAKVK